MSTQLRLRTHAVHGGTWPEVIFVCVVVYLFASFEGVVGASGENIYSHHFDSRTTPRVVRLSVGKVDRVNRAYGVKKSKKRSVAWRR